MINAVIFDMDGTLFDTEVIYARAWRAAGAELHFAEIEQAIAACTGCNLKDTRRYFEENFADVISYDAFIAVRDRYYLEEIARKGIPLKPGVMETLTYLKENKIKIALGTATAMDRTRENLNKTGIADYFDGLVTGDMVKEGKPNPETFLTAAQMLGVAAEECMGVEDSFNGIRAIHAAGMFTVMVPDTVQPTEEIRALLDAECQTLFEIKPIIEKINEKEKRE